MPTTAKPAAPKKKMMRNGKLLMATSTVLPSCKKSPYAAPQDYGAITEMKPSNAAILRQLEKPSRYPAERVCRKYYFPHAMPPEYYCFTDNETYRKERHHTIQQQFTPISFRNLAEDEQTLGTGHCLPGEEAA